MVDGKIQTFLTVCNYMNYTKAAEELHLTQQLCPNKFMVWRSITIQSYLSGKEENYC